MGACFSQTESGGRRKDQNNGSTNEQVRSEDIKMALEIRIDEKDYGGEECAGGQD
jgi:hypothetical protein